MAARTWIALLATVALLAGCTAPETAPDAAPPAPEPPAPPAPAPAPAPPPAAAPPPPPNDFTLADEGEIQGPFEASWPIALENVAYRSAQVHFALEGFQPGAPPTARVQLTLYDPAGNAIQTGAVGLGAPSHELVWGLTPAQLTQAGTYELRAVAASEGPVPSAGFAKYRLSAEILY